MRLTPFQTICNASQKYFGEGSQVWLFGSRMDDRAKGGDIDLYIETQMQNPAELIDAKLQFLSDLHQKLGEQKIDVILRRTNSTVELPIYCRNRTDHPKSAISPRKTRKSRNKSIDYIYH